MEVHKIFNLRENAKTKTCSETKKTKNAEKNERWRETECFQNQTFHIEIKNNQNTEKPTSVIMYNIKIFYFLIKVSRALQGGRVEGNDGVGLNHYLS